MAWRETRLEDRSVFSGWDPYGEPPGRSLVPWFVILGTVGGLALFQQRVTGFGIALLPLLLGLVCWRAKRYRLEVSPQGFALARSWWGFTWWRRVFPPQSFVTYADDPWETGWFDEGFALIIYDPEFVDRITFGRGRRCVELSERIMQVAEEWGCWKRVQ